MTTSEQPKQIGKYRIERVLGAGAMATVYEAYDSTIDRHVALKVLKRQLLTSPEAVHAFVDEARRTAALEHDHIPRIFDLGEVDGVPFLAMGRIHGQPLSKAIAQGGGLSVDRLRTVIVQVGSALTFAHSRNVLHCDIKPGNVLLDTAGKAWLTDFGISHALGLDGGSRETTTMSSPRYASPEQLEQRAVNIRSDVYSLGLLLYEACTGRLPFAECKSTAELVARKRQPLAPLPSSIRKDLSKALDALLLAATSADPARRPANAEEFTELAKQALTPAEIRPRREPLPSLDRTQVGEPTERPRHEESVGDPRPVQAPKSKRWLLAIGICLAAALVAAKTITLPESRPALLGALESAELPGSRQSAAESRERPVKPLPPALRDEPVRIGLRVEVPGPDLDKVRVELANRLVARFCKRFGAVALIEARSSASAFRAEPHLDFLIGCRIQGRLESLSRQPLPRYAIDKVRCGFSSRLVHEQLAVGEAIPAIEARDSFTEQRVVDALDRSCEGLETVWAVLDRQMDNWRTHGRPRLVQVLAPADQSLVAMEEGLSELGKLEALRGVHADPKVVLAGFALDLDERAKHFAAPPGAAVGTEPTLPSLRITSYLLFSGQPSHDLKSRIAALVKRPFVCVESDGAILFEAAPGN